MEYGIHLAILVCIYLILAQGFNLIFGLGNMFNLAHVALFSIGAYVTGLGSTELGLGFWECLVCSFLVSGVSALLVGGIALRLSSDYFAIGSLAFASVISSLEINWKSITKGVLGIPGIPRPVISGREILENREFLLLIGGICLLSQVVIYCIFRSPFARALRAQGEFEDAARSLGHDIRLYRTTGFFLGSCFAGLAGSFFAYYMNYIDPSSFGLSEMIFVITIAVVGRPGSFWGVIASAVFLVLIPEPLRFLEIPASVLGPMRQLIYALILFSVVFINRARLFPMKRVI